MNDLISRSALINELYKRIFTAEIYNDDFDGTVIGNLLCLGDVKEVADELPTVEVKHDVHGEWNEFDIDYGGIPTVGYQCSECGQSNGFITDFCPNCGADMRGEKNERD